MCNLETEIAPLLSSDEVVCTEDGQNCWGTDHEQAVGVAPGWYTNVNAGFLSFNTADHRRILCEWRNLMTRRKPFDLWHGDQGAINAVMDKYAVKKRMLEKKLWNQTHLNGEMAERGDVEQCGDILRLRPTGQRIFAWHGTGWHKLWHCIGIDHYRENANERQRFFEECQGKVPTPVAEHFKRFLFLDQYNQRLVKDGFRLRLPGT